MNPLISKTRFFTIVVLIYNWSAAFSQVTDAPPTSRAQSPRKFNYSYVREESYFLNDTKLSLYVKKERRNSITFTVSTLATSSIALFMLANDNIEERTGSIMLSISVSGSILSFIKRDYYQRKAIINNRCHYRSTQHGEERTRQQNVKACY